MKKVIWFSLGWIFLALAFIGIVVPGIPWSTPAVVAAICFSKSSDRMHNYLYNHKLFGPFLTNWKEKKIFPTKAKYAMLVTMSTSLIIAWFTIPSAIGFSCLVILMAAVAIWGWRYPGSEAEYEARKVIGTDAAWPK